MSDAAAESPALKAAREAEAQVLDCVTNKHCFLLEAGAGAGKTYSLIETLKHLIETQGDALRRAGQKVACITYTNAGRDVINERIDSSPVVFTETIHAFSWSLMKGFQTSLRDMIKALPKWEEKLQEFGELTNQEGVYELGHRRVSEATVSLHHDDILSLMVQFLALEKFQRIITDRYPVILIDEYQDTNAAIMDAIKSKLVNSTVRAPLVGLFGDHWQRIYDETCGHVEDAKVKSIGKEANFRSATSIVAILNKMRPELPQHFKDEAFVGSAHAFHTNSWKGERRSGSGGHWNGDLPADVAHGCLTRLTEGLKTKGWDFAPDKTKVLMLTHGVLATEQGYSNLLKVFPFADAVIKKEDEFIAFFADKLEPACDAFLRRRYGEMFEVLGEAAPTLASHIEKARWAEQFEELIALRQTGTIGQILDHIANAGQPVLPEGVLKHYYAAKTWQGEEGEEVPEAITRIRNLARVPYKEVIEADKFIDGHTPFSTKHGVKGEQYENVLVVVGRGWNKYNFDQYLEWAGAPDKVPAAKRASYERNRNLFYVACSRPTTRLAVLFTQQLSAGAMKTIATWFGEASVHDFSP
jgi:DNA helicase II / ATP-dependent DNA helicase PcrA